MHQFGQLRSSSPKLPGGLGIASLFIFIVAVIVAVSTARAEDEAVTTRGNFERIAFPDAEIADGFFKIALGAELRFREARTGFASSNDLSGPPQRAALTHRNQMRRAC